MTAVDGERDRVEQANPERGRVVDVDPVVDRVQPALQGREGEQRRAPAPPAHGGEQGHAERDLPARGVADEVRQVRAEPGDLVVEGCAARPASRAEEKLVAPRARRPRREDTSTTVHCRRLRPLRAESGSRVAPAPAPTWRRRRRPRRGRAAPDAPRPSALATTSSRRARPRRLPARRVVALHARGPAPHPRPRARLPGRARRARAARPTRRLPRPRPRRGGRPRARPGDRGRPAGLRAAGPCAGRPARTAAAVCRRGPRLPRYRAQLADLGADVVGVPVDADGLRVDLLAGTGADAVLATPAHQSPTGAALAPERRRALVDWAPEGPRRHRGRLRRRVPLRPRPGWRRCRGSRLTRWRTRRRRASRLAPGLRLGWIVGAGHARRPLGAGTCSPTRLAHAGPARAGLAARHRRLRPPPARGTAQLPRPPRCADGGARAPACPQHGSEASPPASTPSSARPRRWTRSRSCRPPARSVGVYPLGWSYVDPAPRGRRNRPRATRRCRARDPRGRSRALAAAVAEARNGPFAPPSAETIALLMTLPPG